MLLLLLLLLYLKRRQNVLLIERGVRAFPLLFIQTWYLLLVELMWLLDNRLQSLL